MTTPNIPEVTDTVRRCVTAWETTRPEHRTLADAEELMQALRDALPTPPRPTLADLPPEERAACDWMQADVEALDGPWLIIDPTAADHAHVVDREGKNRLFPARYVTPRPDLPRWEWPGDTPSPSLALPGGWRLADHQKYGRVVVTNTTPDADGHVYFVAPAPEPLGNDWHPCDPGELTYLDQEAEDVTPARMGDVIESADDPRLDTLPVGSVLADCDGDDVEKTERGWKGDGYIPRPIEGDKFGPWTVCRIGKEADQ